LLYRPDILSQSGDLSCPASGSQIIDTPGGSLDCSIYDDASDDLDADQIDDRVERRSLKNSFLTDNSTGSPFKVLAKSNMQTCVNFINIPSYGNTPITGK
jgi:hypothetical protein